MIRNILPKDLPKLKELTDWEFGPDYMKGLVLVDAKDDPVVFAGAWMIAEVHLAIDPRFGTPGARLSAVNTIHAAMEQELRQSGARQAVTWLGDNHQPFGRRLAKLGWQQSSLKSWHRGIR